MEDPDESFALSLQIALLSDDTGFDPRIRPRTPHSKPTALSDFALARELFGQDLKALQQISFDRRLAASIRRAVVQDADVINLEINENKTFQDDLLIAQRLRETPDAPIPTGDLNGGPAKRVKVAQFMVPTPPGVGVGRSNTSPGFREHRNLYCNVCTEILPDYEIVSLSCQHNYCRTCLRTTFVQTLTSRSFPPRCCSTIPTTLAAEVLDDTELEKYLHASVVHDAISGPEKRRRNCARSTCGQVLLPGWIKEDVALCLKCDEKTCMVCGEKAHPGGECPKDEDTVNLFKLAEGKRWQRCPRCGSVVELVQGCFHMTCLCNHQFCYKCAATWKTCTCLQADESYITGRATTSPTPPTASTSFFSRTVSSTHQTQLDLEHRQQALRYDEGLKRRLEELKTLRRTRESQRDAVMVDRMVWEEEDRVRRELMEEERKWKEEERREKMRRRELRDIFEGVLGRVSDNVAGKRNGKGKARERARAGEEGELEGVAGKLVEWTMLVESTPTEPSQKQGFSISALATGLKPTASRKRDLSPAT